MDLGLADKVAWVTGASGGIGRAIAEAFALEGASVALQGNQGIDEAREWLEAQPWKARAILVEADVTRAEAVDAAAERVLERFGRIDCCAANAGVWPSEHLTLDELPEERIRRTIEVDLVGALFSARAFLRALKRTGPRKDGHGAALVFTGSTAGRFGERGHVDYAAAKGALHATCKTLKNEIVSLDLYGRVNVVEPGWTVTHMARPALQVPGMIERSVATMALRQLARAKDVARTVVWLCSPLAARHLTGEVISLAGGMEGRVLWTADEIDRAEIQRRLREA
jgi:3-oxoacyl-[acyl-carrier protein] reductase